jgi:hypothetical protein
MEERPVNLSNWFKDWRGPQIRLGLRLESELSKPASPPPVLNVRIPTVREGEMGFTSPVPQLQQSLPPLPPPFDVAATTMTGIPQPLPLAVVARSGLFTRQFREVETTRQLPIPLPLSATLTQTPSQHNPTAKQRIKTFLTTVPGRLARLWPLNHSPRGIRTQNEHRAFILTLCLFVITAGLCQSPKLILLTVRCHVSIQSKELPRHRPSHIHRHSPCRVCLRSQNASQSRQNTQ